VSEHHYIVNISLDERSVVRRSPQIEHERQVAIYDLLDENEFKPEGDFDGPYNLHLRIEENRLIFDIRAENDTPLTRCALPVTVFRKIVKDYFMICDSYFEAIKTKTPSQIEAIDMGRRGLHNEGADVLRERLGGKIALDRPTSRRLFTLICVLHIRT
jgi:uncharacterized protein (UPF0262 family)